MYRRILLAYDGSLEGRTALREGALLAYHCKAEVYLLSVSGGSAGFRMAEGAHPGAGAHQHEQLKLVLAEGVERLKRIGFSPVAKLVIGDPADEICHYAKEIGADLVVVGHRRQNFFERWWSGSRGAYLVDQMSCSLLISQNIISDADFEAALNQAAQIPDPIK